MSNPQFMQEAYYALAKHEAELSEEMAWRERRQFLQDFVAQRETELALKKASE